MTESLNKVKFLSLLLFAIFGQVVECHVGLTFPSARKLELDFLDNARTKKPCGMPKGKDALRCL